MYLVTSILKFVVPLLRIDNRNKIRLREVLAPRLRGGHNRSFSHLLTIWSNRQTGLHLFLMTFRTFCREPATHRAHGTSNSHGKGKLTMNTYMLLPLILSSVVWAMAFKQVIRGVVFGEMIEYVRANNESHRCDQGNDPIPFVIFFIFYSAVTFAVPISLWMMVRAG